MKECERNSEECKGTSYDHSVKKVQKDTIKRRYFLRTKKNRGYYKVNKSESSFMVYINIFLLVFLIQTIYKRKKEKRKEIEV